MTANQVAKFLAMNNIPVISFQEGTMHEDGEVRITPEIYVGVGSEHTYYTVVRECENGEAFVFYAMRARVELILPDIAQAMHDHEKEKGEQ